MCPESNHQKEMASACIFLLKLLAPLSVGVGILSMMNESLLFNSAILVYIILAVWVAQAR